MPVSIYNYATAVMCAIIGAGIAGIAALFLILFGGYTGQEALDAVLSHMDEHPVLTLVIAIVCVSASMAGAGLLCAWGAGQWQTQQRTPGHVAYRPDSSPNTPHAHAE